MQQPELDIGTRADYAKACLATAGENIAEAELLASEQHYGGAANRIYNAVFRAVMAVHNIDGHSYKNHKDALGQFNKLYLKEEIFPRHYGATIYEIQAARHKSDYGYQQNPSAEAIGEYIAFAKELYATLKAYCDVKIK